MGSRIGILTKLKDRFSALEEFAKRRNFEPSEFNPQTTNEFDLLIVDVDAINSKFSKSIKSITEPVLFVSFPDTKKTGGKAKVPEDLLDTLFKADFVEIEIKDGKIYPEFIVHFKIGVLLKLKKGTQTLRIREGKSKKETPLVEKANFQKKIDAKSALVVIGSSAGGPGTLVKLFSQIKKPTPPLVIVQHITTTFAETLANRLNKVSSVKLKLARNGDLLQNNCAYLAPPETHLEFEQIGNKVKIILSDGPKVNFVKPAVDITLFSAARLKGIYPISIILTGMGSDGKEGSRIIKRAGGTVIALNEEDSVVFGMNRSVIEANLADFVVSLDQIPGLLRKLTY